MIPYASLSWPRRIAAVFWAIVHEVSFFMGWKKTFYRSWYRYLEARGAKIEVKL